MTMTLSSTLSANLFIIIVLIYCPTCLFSTLTTPPIKIDPNRRYCDEDFCDSLVTKCKITNKCSCDLEIAQCAKDCIDCLEEKFGKCCACVGLCPAQENDIYSSHVGDTSESDEQIFEVLTETDDIHGRWTVMTDSGSFRLTHPEYGPIELAYRVEKDSQPAISHDSSLRKLNCTVAFINRHLSMTKCKRSCTTMGASYFRWFHDGCCECVSKYCLNYGIDKPGCTIHYD